MKKPGTIAREISLTQARIAALRKDHARIGEKISRLLATQQAQVTELVVDAIGKMDVSRLPIDGLLSAISKMTQDAAEELSSMSLSSAAEETADVFVRISRNASLSNRQLLELNGLHWNGRDGGWTGTVTHDQLVQLRGAFGERVKRPETFSAEEEPAVLLERGPGTGSSAVDASAKPAREREGQVEATVKEVSSAMLRSPFRGLPSGRPVST